MVAVHSDIRAARSGDAVGLAELHRQAWHGAYRGIIAPLTLERMIARRGVPWWEATITANAGGFLVLCFAQQLAGYASIGPSRSRLRGLLGEIYELYLRPEFQGLGFGTRLFDAARSRLDADRLHGHLVWALTDNIQACAFYRAKGGAVAASNREKLGGNTLHKTAFCWP
jgi:ribosomal protein S18 acetylase RimI-like enzyme